MSAELAGEGRALPVGSIGSRASGWWGAWFLVLSEASIFAYLFFCYFYFAVQPTGHWVPAGEPSFKYSAPQSAVILLGSATAWWASRSAALGRTLPVLIALALTVLLGAAFIALELLDWYDKPFSFASSAYSSIYFAITGFHLAHVVAGWIIFVLLFVWTAAGYFNPVRHVPIRIGALYWYFLAVVWLAVFFVLYGTPKLS